MKIMLTFYPLGVFVHSYTHTRVQFDLYTSVQQWETCSVTLIQQRHAGKNVTFQHSGPVATENEELTRNVLHTSMLSLSSLSFCEKG